MTFTDIEFGFADANDEKIRNPQLLLDGFFDEKGYYNEAKDGYPFLILGQKGSGKSAIASKIELEAENNDELFVKKYQLGNFPYKKAASIFPKKEAPETKHILEWELLLYLALFDNLLDDKDIIFSNEKQYKALINILKDNSILPALEMTKMVKTTSNKKIIASFFAQIKGEYQNISENIPKNIEDLLIELQSICLNAKVKNRHLIIIDGLDDITTSRNIQYKSLSALILASKRMNDKFSEKNINVKILVLCRVDLYDKLPGSNNNKMKRDSAIILDWYDDIENVYSTNLVKLVNKRACLSIKRNINLFKLLPRDLKNEDTCKILLGETRHTPRDIIQLMNEIKKHTQNGNPSRSNIKNAIRTYSTDYFKPELNDELDLYFNVEQKMIIFNMLSFMGKSEFSYDEIKELTNNDKRFHNINLNETLDILFNCSIIGNLRFDKSKYNSVKYYSWRYRNRAAFFNPNEKIIVHRGLRKALNLP